VYRYCAQCFSPSARKSHGRFVESKASPGGPIMSGTFALSIIMLIRLSGANLFGVGKFSLSRIRGAALVSVAGQLEALRLCGPGLFARDSPQSAYSGSNASVILRPASRQRSTVGRRLNGLERHPKCQSM